MSEPTGDEAADTIIVNNDHDMPVATATHDVIIAEKLAKAQEHDSEIATLDRSFRHKILYIIGKEQMKILKDATWFRKILLSMFLWLRDNTRNKMANLRVPTDQVIEVGFLKEIR